MFTFNPPQITQMSGAGRSTCARTGSTPLPLLGLDLLRILAAAVVTAHHVIFGMWNEGQRGIGYTQLGPALWFGSIGVQVFFVLSGFLIPYTARKATFTSFLKSRFTRLYPAAWICATITALDLLLTHTPPQFAPRLGPAWVRTLLLSPVGPWVDGSYWTLSVEMVFYTLIASLLVIHRNELIGQVMSLVGILSATCWIIYVLILQHSVRSQALEWISTKACNSATGQYLLLRYGCQFALGTMLWLILTDRLTVSRTIIAVYLIVGCCCEIFAHFYQQFPLEPLLFWCACLVALVLTVRQNASLHAFFGERGAKVIRRLGLITYPLYLLHQQNGYIWTHRLQNSLIGNARLLLILPGLYIVSYLANRFAEEPLQIWLRRRLTNAQIRVMEPSGVAAATLP